MIDSLVYFFEHRLSLLRLFCMFYMIILIDQSKSKTNNIPINCHYVPIKSKNLISDLYIKS